VLSLDLDLGKKINRVELLATLGKQIIHVLVAARGNGFTIATPINEINTLKFSYERY